MHVFTAMGVPLTNTTVHQQIWNDVKGRTVYAQVLIEDRTPKLSMMTGGAREAFDFGDEVRGKVKGAVDSFA